MKLVIPWKTIHLKSEFDGKNLFFLFLRKEYFNFKNWQNEEQEISFYEMSK